MIGEPFDLQARMAIDQRLDQVVRNAVAQYLLNLSGVLGRPVRPDRTVFPLYYPGMPAYDAARKRARELDAPEGPVRKPSKVPA